MSFPDSSSTDAPRPVAASGVTFASLNLIEPLLRALSEKNYTVPSPIQAQAIPPLLLGRDLLGLAQTGTGKTAGFTLPILQRLVQNPVPKRLKCPRALILTPTRELAAQVEASVQSYGKHTGLRSTVAFGGVGMGNQMKILAKGVDILVATPGRLLDLCKRQAVRLEHVEIFVLDEADRMLDMGFGRDVKRIEEFIPSDRQTLLFSATLPDEIRAMAEGMMNNPVRVAITPEKPTVERIEQSVCFVERNQKLPALLHFWREVTDSGKKGLTIVFARTKVGANRLSGLLRDENIPAEAIHGNKSQAQRENALKKFRANHSSLLIATDIAARGIDVKGIALVVNYDLPDDPESYVHRIGRTARAGAGGRAVAFCSHDELVALRDVEKFIRGPIPVLADQPYHSPGIASQYRPWSSLPPRRGERDNLDNLPDVRKSRFQRGGPGGGGAGGGQNRRRPSSPQGKSSSQRFEKRGPSSAGPSSGPRDGAPREWKPRGPVGAPGVGPKEPFFKKLWKGFGANEGGAAGDSRPARSEGGKPAYGKKPFGPKPSGGKPFGKKPYGGGAPGGFKKKFRD